MTDTNTNQLSKEDLKQLEDDLKVLKEKYESELAREKSERDLQATRDSEQAEIFAKKKVEESEAKELADKAKQKKEVKESEELKTFRSAVLESLNKIDESNQNQVSNESIETLNENIEVLIEYQKNQAQMNTNQDWYLSIIAISIILFPAIYFAIKFGWGMARRIMSIITT